MKTTSIAVVLLPLLWSASFTKSHYKQIRRSMEHGTKWGSILEELSPPSDGTHTLMMVPTHLAVCIAQVTASG